jgi:ubiquitin-protein ligase/uncharacterized protein YegL
MSDKDLGERPRVLVQFLDKRKTGPPSEMLLFCRLNETVAEMQTRLWALRVVQGSYSLATNPSTIDLWHGLKDIGDGNREGQCCTWSKTLFQCLSMEARATLSAAAAAAASAVSDTTANTKLAAGTASATIKPTMTFEMHRHQAETSREKSYLTRIQTVKQLFHAYINRSQAYNYGSRIALMLFADESELACDFTSSLETFRHKVDRVEARGDTNLFEAINKAVKLLNDKHKEQFPKARKRIIVLSDGCNTSKNKSTSTEPHMVAQNVQRSDIVVDVVQIGEEQNQDRNLRGIARASGGYCFAPRTLADALKLNELETFLCSLERPDSKRPELVSYPVQLGNLARRPLDFCDETHKAPERKRVKELDSKFSPLVKCFGGADVSAAPQATQAAPKQVLPESKTTATAASVASHKKPEMLRQKRIMLEMRALIRDPHKEFDIFVNPEDIGLWKLIVQGPSSTPYKDGCWVLYIAFGAEYPRKAPEVRFVTPIKHCNINVHGKVCHSIFDKNWTPDTGIMTVLQCVYGLLLTPDTTDPLDSTLALAFYDDSGKYEADILMHVKAHANKTRQQLADSM